jgi:hypothetical protein
MTDAEVGRGVLILALGWATGVTIGIIGLILLDRWQRRRGR